MSGLPFVSVVFEAEVSLLRLQARSMALYLAPGVATDIIVIDNTARGLPAETRDALLAEYGPLRPAVRILRPRDIRSMPRAVGWRSQQVLKLCVVDLLGDDNYVVLDAKNHFVKSVDPAFFVTAEGTPRVTAYGYETHPLRRDLEHVLRYLGLDPAPFVPRFTATVTPFVLTSLIVRTMIADIEARSGRDFAREFVARDLTEFFLYSGWVAASGRDLDSAFDLTVPASPSVWPRGATPEGVAASIEASVASESPVFSVHRRALARLDDAASALLARHWTTAKLFDSEARAVEFIRDFQADAERRARGQGLRDLPPKLARAPRVIARRLGARLSSLRSKPLPPR